MQLRSLRLYFQSSVYRIWRGESPELGRRFTVKELLPDVKSGEVYLKWISQETEFLVRFAHERILGFVSSDSPDLVLHEDTQCSLEQLVSKRGTLANEQVASVLTQCLEGLAFLDSRDFAHGTLCARNVFVDPTGSVKLGDFTGYRYERDRPSVTNYPLQKYQAPEVIDKDLGRCGPTSDLYCLGFLALELLAGDQFPQLLDLEAQQDEPQRWLRWHANTYESLSDWQEKLPDVSQKLGEFISGLVHKDASLRAFKTPAEALTRLNDLGLCSRRALPLYDQVAPEPSGGSQGVFRPPSRRLGPNLRLIPRKKKNNVPIRTFPHDKPLLIDLKSSRREISEPLRLALLSCQHKDWFVYNLPNHASTRHNGQVVPNETPRKIRRNDELQFGDDRYIVDLILQGTGIVKGFDLLHRVHSGAGGELYGAKWYRRSMRIQNVAIRILPGDFGKEIEEIRRFLRAIPAAGRLKHPNIVRLYKGGRVRQKDSSTWYIASEFMQRGSLRDKLSRPTKNLLGLKRLKQLALDISAALIAAREHNVLHRNINPSCILFNKGRVAKLGDFTLSRSEVMESMYDITRGKILEGDHIYQAPEILLGNSDLSPSCDLYSLCVCLFEAILGKLPVEPGSSDAATITKMCSYDWPSIREFDPEVPAEWDSLLRKTLQRDPSSRITCPIEFRQEVLALPEKIKFE